MCVYIYIYTYVSCMYIYVYIYIYVYPWAGQRVGFVKVGVGPWSDRRQ